MEAKQENDDDGILVTPEKRQERSKTDVIKILERSLAATKDQQEESNRLRDRES